MKKTTLALVLAAFLPGIANSDVVGVTAGAYSWEQEHDGFVRSGTSQIELQNELGLDQQTNQVAYIAVEHPIPLLPNIRLQHTSMEIEGQATLTSTIDFNGQTFLAATPLQNSADFTHTDATLYYELLDNWVNLDIGLTIRQFDGEVELVEVGGSNQANEEFDATLPMLYANARFDLPFTGSFISAEVNAISYSDASLIDYRIAAGYEFDLAFGLGIEAGVRRFDLDYDDGDEQADFSVDGVFIGAFLDF